MAVGFVLEVRAARSGGGPKAQRASPAAQRAAKARYFSVGFVLGARPHAPLKRRPRRGRRPKGRTSTAQSTPQFSAPCQPHCGSAVAPPRFPSPAAILAGLAECQPAEYAYFRRAGDGFLRGIVFFARCSLSARLGDSFSFGLSPKELNRFFRRGARLVIAPAGTVLFVNKENQKNFRRMLTHPQTASTSVLRPRAGGNLIQTRNTRLNDFLFQQSRAVRLRRNSNGRPP